MQKGFSTTLLLVGLVIVGLVAGVFYMGRQSAPKTIPSPAPSETSEMKPAISKIDPKYVVFMRKGDIYFKDFTQDQELRVSKTSKVSSPRLSPSSRYVAYFQLVHGGGGFPTGNVYLLDTQGTSETLLGITNEFASRLTWTEDGDYLGLMLFPDGQKSSTVLYDASQQKKILEKEINSYRTDNPNYPNIPVLTTDKSYNVNLECSKLEAKYQSFCKEYESMLNSEVKPQTYYKSEFYNRSQYTKPGYRLITSKQLSNGLVVLEYYTGEPQNPESKWGIGGGSFIPGYDQGVTETYTVLLNEATGQVIKELPLAVDTDFLF